jgi:hypothetical protein
MIVAVSLETVRQNFTDQNLISPPGAAPATERPGSYRSESVTPTPENSVLTKAAAEGASVLTTSSANLRDLAQRVRDEPAATTTALYATLANLPEANNTALPQMYQFVDGLAELVGEATNDETGKTEEGEVEVGGEQTSERERASADDNDGRVSMGGDGGGHGHDDDSEAQQRRNELENAIHKALGKLGTTADKAAAIAMARGYFEARGANPDFLNVLNKLSGQFDGIMPESLLAQLAAAQEATLADATLESSPAAVRRRYRKRLREKRNLGELFEELAQLGLEVNFPTLFTEIGADLAGVSRQSDRDYLRSLTAELKKLWQLKSAHEETKELVRITEPHLPKSARKPGSLKLTASVLYYCGKAVVGPADAQTLLGLVEGASLAGQVVFANALRDLHARMPDGIWLVPKERLLQYTVLGALCHRLTEAEEQFYEETEQS